MTKISDERLAQFIETSRRMGDAGDGNRYNWWDDLVAILTEFQSIRVQKMANDDCIATPTMILAAQEAERKHYGINRGAGFRSTGAMELKKLIEAALVQRKQEALRAHNSDSAEPVAWLTPYFENDPSGKLVPIIVSAETTTTIPEEYKPLYLASPPAKEVDTNLINEVIEFLGGVDGAVELRGKLIALTNRTPDNEGGNG